jgi:hypothetical protein
MKGSAEDCGAWSQKARTPMKLWTPGIVAIEVTAIEAEALLPEMRRLGLNNLAETLDARMHPKRVTVCDVCGSPDVEWEVWAAANGESVSGGCDGDPWCQHCEEHDQGVVDVDPKDVLDPTLTTSVKLSPDALDAIDGCIGLYLEDGEDDAVAGSLWNLSKLADKFYEAARQDVKRPLRENLRLAAADAATAIRAAVEEARK